MRIEQSFIVKRPPEALLAGRLLEPIAKRVLARQMRAYHENLRRNLEE